jgi:hypothetical protein
MRKKERPAATRAATRALSLAVSLATVLFLTGGALAASTGGGGNMGGGTQFYSPPFGYGGAWSTTSCDWLICGTNNIYDDLGYGHTGQVYAWTQSTSEVLEGATATANVQFVQPLTTFATSATRAVSYLWHLTWSATDIATCIPALGASYAASSITFSANVWDVTNTSWVVLGGSYATVYASSQLCPIAYSSAGNSNEWFTAGFNAYLQAGHEYLFVIDLIVSTTAYGLVVGTATATANVGVNPNSESYLATVTVG